MPRVDARNPYAVLGVSSSASSAEVQRAFRRELMKWHPDHNQATDFDPVELQTRTRQIIDAYRELKRSQ